MYQNSSKTKKMAISKSIYKVIREADPPSRFLSWNPETRVWFEISDRRAVEKTAQALRDKKHLRADTKSVKSPAELLKDLASAQGENMSMKQGATASKAKAPTAAVADLDSLNAAFYEAFQAILPTVTIGYSKNKETWPRKGIPKGMSSQEYPSSPPPQQDDTGAPSRAHGFGLSTPNSAPAVVSPSSNESPTALLRPTSKMASKTRNKDSRSRRDPGDLHFSRPANEPTNQFDDPTSNWALSGNKRELGSAGMPEPKRHQASFASSLAAQGPLRHSSLLERSYRHHQEMPLGTDDSDRDALLDALLSQRTANQVSAGYSVAPPDHTIRVGPPPSLPPGYSLGASSGNYELATLLLQQLLAEREPAPLPAQAEPNMAELGTLLSAAGNGRHQGATSLSSHWGDCSVPFPPVQMSTSPDYGVMIEGLTSYLESQAANRRETAMRLAHFQQA